MSSFLIHFFTLGLLFISAFIVLVVLMQRPSSNAGMGSALGGGAAESAFGGETTNVLTRWTIYGAVAFFILAFGLYLGCMAKHKVGENADALPTMTAPATTTTTPAAK